MSNEEGQTPRVGFKGKARATKAKEEKPEPAKAVEVKSPAELSDEEAAKVKTLEDQVKEALALTDHIPHYILTPEQAGQIARLFAQLEEVDKLILFPLFMELSYLRELVRGQAGHLSMLAQEVANHGG